MKVVLAGKVNHSIKATRIKPKLWGVRCFTNGVLNQEIQVQCQSDIGVAAAEMLKTEIECGNQSEFASKSKERFYKGPKWRSYKRPMKKVI